MVECNFCSWDRGKLYKINPECPVHGRGLVKLDYFPPHPWKQPEPSDGPLLCAVCGEPLFHPNHKVEDYAPKEKPPSEDEG